MGRRQIPQIAHTRTVALTLQAFGVAVRVGGFLANELGEGIDSRVGRPQPGLVHNSTDNEMAAQVPMVELLLIDARIRIAQVNRRMVYSFFDPGLLPIGSHV